MSLDPAAFVTLAELEKRGPWSRRVLLGLLKKRGLEVHQRRAVALAELAEKWPQGHASLLLVRADEPDR